ncbi:hypothetical protein [Winogradskyella poriferorum]|uniref:hypothetical protein n=1 Tax=Winogradskyella poriferorum TaxID=307627 RepID=UPI003D64CF94
MYKVDEHRRLCLYKDLKEIELWLYNLEIINEDLNHFKTLEKQLIKSDSLVYKIKANQRTNVLLMAGLCKYENELKTELGYSKTKYDNVRAKYHMQKRKSYVDYIQSYTKFKNEVYRVLLMFKR